MTKETNNSSRRSALRQFGAAVVGLLGWRVAKASTAGSEGVFANLFLQESKSVHVPLGYYDPKTQRYLDSKTHKPIFAPEASEEKRLYSLNADAGTKQLSEADLENLLKSGRFVDAMALEKLRAFGGWCTLSQLTTLSTSGCCPIVTDSSRDTQCDDTTSNPPN